MTDEHHSHQQETSPEATSPEGDAPAPANEGPTPAQLLGVGGDGAPVKPVSGQTPAQLLGVTPDLTDSLNLDEPQGRDASLSTEVRKGADTSETRDKKG